MRIRTPLLAVFALVLAACASAVTDGAASQTDASDVTDTTTQASDDDQGPSSTTGGDQGADIPPQLQPMAEIWTTDFSNSFAA